MPRPLPSVSARRESSRRFNVPVTSSAEVQAAYPITPLSFDREIPTRGPQPVDVRWNAFEELLDLREAASLLGMHWKTLESMARGRRIPALKVGKRWRFRVSALNSWLEHGINSNTTNHAALTGKDLNFP